MRGNRADPDRLAGRLRGLRRSVANDLMVALPVPVVLQLEVDGDADGAHRGGGAADLAVVDEHAL